MNREPAPGMKAGMEYSHRFRHVWLPGMLLFILGLLYAALALRQIL